MGLGDVRATTVPKLTLVAPPRAGGALATRTFIPHRCHDAIGVLGAVSVATAALLPEGPAAEVARLDGSDVVTVEHPTGTFDAAVALARRDGAVGGGAGGDHPHGPQADGRGRVPPVTTIPPPHPDPHAPTAFRPPPLACDAHCHVFGPADRFPFAADRRYTPPDAGVDDLARLHARLGLDRAVIVQASCHGTDNAALLDALRRGDGHYAGVAMIDEATTDAELDELHEAGVRGTRMNFVAHLGGAPDADAVERIVFRAADRGWHVVLHLDAADLARYAPLLAWLPCPYVIDHMGRVDATAGLDQEPFRALLGLLHQGDRCWVKLSGAERLTAVGAAAV